MDKYAIGNGDPSIVNGWLYWQTRSSHTLLCRELDGVGEGGDQECVLEVE